MPSKKKKYNSRFPPARIKKIMQSDEEVGKVAQVVPIIVSNALESFVKQLLSQTLAVTKSRNARTLAPNHIKCTILSKPEFAFLRELANTVPDVNKDAEDDEQEQQMAAQNIPSTSKNGFAAPTASTSSGQPPGVPKRGRPRKRPLEDDVPVQPLDYATRKVSKAPYFPQPSPSGSSAAALAAIVGPGSVRDGAAASIAQQPSIINRPGTSRPQVVSPDTDDDDDTDDEEEEEENDEDEEENSDEEEEVTKPIDFRKGARAIGVTRGTTTRATGSFGTPTTTSSNITAAVASAMNSAIVAEIDDDYDN